MPIPEMQNKHLLIIGKVWPEPASSAAGSRMLQLLRLFSSRHWRISFACTANASEHSVNLDQEDVERHSITLNNSGFDSFIVALNPGVVIFDRFSTEEQFGWRVAEHCPGALRLLDLEDLHGLRAARQRAVKEKRSATPQDLVNDVAKRELASIYRCDLSLVISRYEMQLLAEFFKVDKGLLYYLPFLEEAISSVEEAHTRAFAERRNFISIGNFLHAPNWDAVLFLKEEIWPMIRKQLPGVELEVYGAYPSPQAFQLHQPKEGFLVRGRATHAGEVMSAARVCLAPLRFGAGLKGKLLDAMRYGTPSITTSIGAEGMQHGPEWNGRIAENAPDFADAAIALYTQEEAWLRAQRQGVWLHNTLFDREQHEPAFMEHILSIAVKLQQHRLENFTGAMLYHHSLLSNKYMALWIEEKNKNGI
jgi:glycosyltransferase involved in cell wall biosynthesis